MRTRQFWSGVSSASLVWALAFLFYHHLYSNMLDIRELEHIAETELLKMQVALYRPIAESSRGLKGTNDNINSDLSEIAERYKRRINRIADIFTGRSKS